MSAFGAAGARAQVVTYNFDVNGATAGFGVTTGSTYDWDDTTNGGFWSNNSVSTTGNIATNGWVQGNFPKFQPAGAPTYTVTVSNTESIAGAFFSTAQTVTLNPIGSGNLSIVSGNQGILGSGSADVTINVPLTGTGSIQPSNGGNLRFNAVNTYTGGTNLVSTGTLIHFNNGSAFGTGPINVNVTTSTTAFVPLLASGGATVTLPNNFTNISTGTGAAGINFAADASTPVVSTGTWTLGAPSFVLRNNGGSTSPLTLSNTISGSGNITLSTNSTGSVITFSGPNTYTGTTSITGAGGTGAGSGKVTLKLGAINTIASSSNVNLAGGVLDPDGFNQNMSSTTLTLSASTAGSTIDYEAGAAEVDFANSSGVPWASGTTLNLANWNPGSTRLRFGTDPTGLLSAQLAEIEFNGSGLGTAQLDNQGYVVNPAPEPSSLLLVGAGAAGLGWYRRRRRA
ncbi:MAG TPA: PEP-CTERM sorting domain-containing protein [Gemmataceae bacterium]|nr:PEP-CTERM sorting domain-containing protein [Gemmataceae bacterium]